ncbi:hypothetical protein KP509_33G005100 [Ceratopteris richardii]|uniref:Thaumatin-like protein n=1 Tax=Ceratopteris richardii TaxID=49495 RepID=A0A8T2QLS5_CERRI|nr:hypothetical protein KP509_33G005100 [Ceratopteris richardii]
MKVIVAGSADGASFTFQNNCKYTVWPGLLPNGGWPLLAEGGFELEAGESRTVDAPVGWSGRFWGRTGCAFTSTAISTVACETGDCGGKMQCGGSGAAPPATLAEFTLAGPQSGNKDFYDVSLVDGYNIPIAIVPGSSNSSSSSNAFSQQYTSSAASTERYVCTIAGCVADLNLNCPSDLQVLADATNNSIHIAGSTVVGCKSACEAFQSAQYCCTGAYANPNTCQASSYSELFKQACPGAYSYAYDDHTSTFTCTGSEYSIVFCPSSLSQKDGVGNLTDEPGSSGITSSCQQSFLLLRIFIVLALLLLL